MTDVVNWWNAQRCSQQVGRESGGGVQQIHGEKKREDEPDAVGAREDMPEDVRKSQHHTKARGSTPKASSIIKNDPPHAPMPPFASSLESRKLHRNRDSVITVSRRFAVACRSESLCEEVCDDTYCRRRSVI